MPVDAMVPVLLAGAYHAGIIEGSLLAVLHRKYYTPTVHKYVKRVLTYTNTEHSSNVLIGI